MAREPLEFVADIPAIDLLAGMTSCAWRWISALIWPSLISHWAQERAAFEAVRREMLLY
ncbi:MAG: hypothetical protein R3F36_12150 [Candidatus Competibacteraceae bacterium]